MFLHISRKGHIFLFAMGKIHSVRIMLGVDGALYAPLVRRVKRAKAKKAFENKLKGFLFFLEMS